MDSEMYSMITKEAFKHSFVGFNSGVDNILIAGNYTQIFFFLKKMQYMEWWLITRAEIRCFEDFFLQVDIYIYIYIHFP